jgi:hypothetical protein
MSDIADSNWHLIAMVRRAGQLIAYQDGVAANTSTSSGGDTSNTLPLRFGAMATLPNPSEYYDGEEDEIRISTVARSADWLATDYKSQSEPDQFVKLGPELQRP